MYKRQTIVSSFVRSDGEVVERVRLMQAKNKDQMRRGEQLAVDMRKTKRKELQSKTRGALNDNVTQRARSVSPMFTGLQVRKFPA